MYTLAESAADDALCKDPLYHKARYRRGLARKALGLYRGAILDFQTVLTQDPGCTAAQTELDLCKSLFGSDEDDVVDSSITPEDDAWPPLLETLDKEWDCGSNSSEYNHSGNDIPCRYYNRGACTRGQHCAHSHAPDYKSVRDLMGRNVCLSQLMVKCRFGPDACEYCHVLSSLPDDWKLLQKDKRKFSSFQEAYDMCSRFQQRTRGSFRNS